MQKEDIGDKINELHEVAILCRRSTKNNSKKLMEMLENYTSCGIVYGIVYVQHTFKLHVLIKHCIELRLCSFFFREERTEGRSN